MNAAQKAESLHNQEFKITWSENNLRYLAGEPDSDRKRQAIETNKAGIRDARAEIERLNAAEVSP